MNEKKLTDDTEINVGMMDEEIVKALENQANGYGAGIVGDLSALTLDLIHRQKAEIERLTEEKEEIRLFNLAIQNGEIDMRIESEMAKSFYNSIIQIFEQNGAKNFFTTTIELESQKGKYAFTIEKVGGVTVAERLAELQKQVDELKEKIMNLKTAMISRVAIKSYDSLLTTPDDVEEIFGDAYESEFNENLGQAVKDTAKEILEQVRFLIEERNCVGGYDLEDETIDGTIFVEVLNELKERYGVEVE